MANRFTRRIGKGFALLGMVLLGACAGTKFNGPGPFERVAIQRDIRAAGNTFAPGAGSNPTQYAVMGITRTPDGRVRANPYFGHFETLPDGKTYFNAQSAPSLYDNGAHFFAAGIGRTLFDGKVAIGTGFTQVGDTVTQEIGAKLKLPTGTEITYSSALDAAYQDCLRELRDNSRVGIAQEIPIQIDGKKLLSGYFETGVHGEPKFKVGGSLELGDFGALDAAFGLATKELQLRYSVPFGEKSQHFWFIGADHNTQTNETNFLIGINLTGYGNRRNPRRRKNGKQPTSGSGNEPHGFKLVQARVDPTTSRVVLQALKNPRTARKLIPAIRARLQRLRTARRPIAVAKATTPNGTAMSKIKKWKERLAAKNPFRRTKPNLSRRPMRR